MTKQLQKKLFFLFLFTLIGFGALQVPFSQLVGSNVKFTLFDFFAPISGAFLGPFFGIASVFSVMVANNLISGTEWTTGTIIRLFPTLFGVFFFATVVKKDFKKSPGRFILAIPPLAILAFLAHPSGREVPYYTLFWLIPIAAYKFRNNLYMRSLGATFTAHSVGGAAWIWAFNLPASVWQSLIPVVISERLLFAAGIAVSFIVLKKVISYLVSKKILPSLDHAVS